MNFKHTGIAGVGSNKEVIVPAGEVWALDWLNAVLVADATVGNRLVMLELRDDANALFAQFIAGAVQPANNTNTYTFMGGVNRLTTFTNLSMYVPMPNKLVVPSRWRFRVWDSAAISAAGDTLTVNYQADKVVGN